MAVERIIDLPQDVGEDALAGFQDDASRQMDLQTAMNGTAHQGGGQHDLQARGFTSDTVGEDAEALYQYNLAQQAAQTGEGLMNEPLYVQEQGYEAPAPQDDASRWRKLYGDSENAKGELRRQLQAQLELNAQLQSHLSANVRPPQFFGQAQSPSPQVSFVPAQPQYPAPQAPQWGPPPPPDTFSNNLEDDRIVYGKDIKGIIARDLAPVMGGLYQMAQSAEQRAQAAQAALFASEKARLGITPQVEQQMVFKYPWLQNINDPGAYLSTLTGLVNNERAATPAPQTNGTSNGAGNPVMQQVARRTMFVERGNNLSRGEPSQRVQASSWEARWAETLRIPYGDPRRTQAQKILLQERQGPQVTGYRDVNILTR